MKKKIEQIKVTMFKKKRQIYAFVCGLLCMYGISPEFVYAGNDDYLKPLNNLKIIVLAIISLAGVVKLAFAISAFSEAFEKHDSSGQNDAIKSCISGGIMTAAPIVLGILTS